MYVNSTIQLTEPIYPHGNILHYQIAALENSTGATLGPLNTSALEIPISMLLTVSGTYLVKVCNICAVSYSW